MAIEVNKQIATAEWRHPSELTPYITNTKKHPIAQIDKVAASIAEFGFDQPIVVDGDGVIIKGHARREASLRLGLDAVPVIVRTDLTPAQVKAARIADNRVAESEWDLDALKLELGTLQDLGFNLELTGFDDIQLGTFLADKTEGLTDPDDAPPLPEHPVTQPGDLWLLGAKVTCPKCRKSMPLERAIKR